MKPKSELTLFRKNSFLIRSRIHSSKSKYDSTNTSIKQRPLYLGKQQFESEIVSNQRISNFPRIRINSKDKHLAKNNRYLDKIKPLDISIEQMRSIIEKSNTKESNNMFYNHSPKYNKINKNVFYSFMKKQDIKIYNTIHLSKCKTVIKQGDNESKEIKGLKIKSRNLLINNASSSTLTDLPTVSPSEVFNNNKSMVSKKEIVWKNMTADLNNLKTLITKQKRFIKQAKPDYHCIIKLNKHIVDGSQLLTIQKCILNEPKENNTIKQDNNYQIESYHDNGVNYISNHNPILTPRINNDTIDDFDYQCILNKDHSVKEKRLSSLKTKYKNKNIQSIKKVMFE